jgi:DNA-binding transcriptional LysR family regulator
MIHSLEHVRSRLRLRHLQLLYLLGENGSLRRCAEAMALTQPAVTKALHELEGLVGETLFQRTSRGLLPNALGDAAIHHARLVFADIEAFHSELAALHEGNLGKLRIGAMGSLAGSLIPRALGRLKVSHPKLEIFVAVDTSDVLLKALECGELDLLAARIPFGWKSEELAFEAFGEEFIEVVARKGHPELVRPETSLAALSQYPWVVQPRPTPLREIFNQIFREAQLAAPQNLVETASTTLTFSMVQQTDMVTLMPKSLLAFYRNIGMLERLPVPLTVHLTSYGLIHRRNRHYSVPMQLVSEAIRKEFAEHQERQTD